MPKLFVFGLLSAYVLAALAKSTLFENGTIITFNEETQSNEILFKTSVLVIGNTVTSIFSSSEADSIAVPPDTERIPAGDLILSPGFIDAHRHGWQTTYRTMFANMTLTEYIPRYGSLSRAPALFTPNDLYLSELMGIYEALDAGVTSILDHSHGVISPEAAEAIFTAYNDSGARIWWGYCFDDAYDRFPIGERMADYRKWTVDQRLSESLVELGVAFDAWAYTGPEDLQEAINLIKSPNTSVLTTHWVGGVWGTDNTPSLLQGLGLINESFPIVFSHGTFITPDEYQLLVQYDHHVSITVESEMQFGMTNYESDRILDQAALGIDTHASFSGDIVGQARLLLQSVRLRAFKQVLDQWHIPVNVAMSANQAFLLATRAGAQALRRPDLGVIRVNATADIVAFNGTNPNMVGWSDPIAAIILHSHVSDIVHVMVDGNLVKREGKLVAENLANVTHLFSSSAKRIQPLAIQEEWPGQGDNWTVNGFPYRQTQIVDVQRGNGTGY